MKPSAEQLLAAIRALPLGQVRLMEVCGTHTMAIAGAGIRSLLPEKLRERGLNVYHHSRVSCNDEGVALGQLMILAHSAWCPAPGARWFSLTLGDNSTPK